MIAEQPVTLLKPCEVIVGLLADISIFLGGIWLALDARQRLGDVKALKRQEKRQEADPLIPMTDAELFQAEKSQLRARTGIYLMTFGFLLQLVLHGVSALDLLTAKDGCQ